MPHVLKNTQRSWKTSLLGIATLIGIGAKAWVAPAILTQPEVIAAITAGLGLVFAKDSDSTGTTETDEQGYPQEGNLDGGDR